MAAEIDGPPTGVGADLGAAVDDVVSEAPGAALGASVGSDDGLLTELGADLAELTATDDATGVIDPFADVDGSDLSDVLALTRDLAQDHLAPLDGHDVHGALHDLVDGLFDADGPLHDAVHDLDVGTVPHGHDVDGDPFDDA